MSGRILQFDDSVHRNVDRLLPWYVNGTLEGDELTMVERHIDECARCQRELPLLRELHAACRAIAGTPDPDVGWRRMERRLDGRGTLAGRPPALLREPPLHHWHAVPHWARWAMAAELAAVLVLGALMLPGRDAENGYRTLGATTVPANTTGTVVVVFDQRSSEAELRRILRDTGATAIDPPTPTGAYVLHVPHERAPAAIERLRQEPAVTLVQPLTATKDE